MSISDKVRTGTYRYLRTPSNERKFGEADFRSQYHIGKQAWRTLQGDFAVHEHELQRARDISASLLEKRDEEPEEVATLEDYMANQDGEMVKAIFISGQRGNATSQALWAKMRKWVTDKPQEINVNITQFALEAARELERERADKGVVEVPPEPPILLDEVREDSGQGEDSHGSI